MEEYQLIAGTSTTLATPAAPSVTIRNAQSNETALGTTIQDVAVAATNYFGTTAVSSQTSISAITTGQVVDVTISPVAGATQYNIWGYDGSTNWYLLATCGGVKFTLQGPLPAIGTHPTTDSGTGKPTRMEGVIPTLSGVSASAGIYPSGWQGGYSNLAGFGCAPVLDAVTWGTTQRMTPAWLAKYCDELYAPLTAKWIEANGDAPSGFDLAQLTADLALV